MTYMRPRTGPVLVLAFILPAVFAPSAPALVQPGHTAPPFELPSLNGGGYVSSGELFPASAYTFLVFWDSGCSHCVQSLLQCELFMLDQTERDVAMYGIHADEGEIADVYRVIQANSITFPQLWDIGGGTAREYGAAFAEFTIFLIDRQGAVVAAALEPEGDLRPILEDMLAGQAVPPQMTIPAASVAESPSSGLGPDLSYKGDFRTRFLAVESRGAGAQGPYGETVTPGNDLLYRFMFELSHRVGRYLTVGGLLRISNEPAEVLEAGPEYLGSEWGSAYAEMRYRTFRFRVGYYQIVMTPLTLMRWDWNDNPRVGGQAGCGCGVQAGVLLLESLEELGPELVFEGAVADYYYEDLRLKAFYAIPRRANRTPYLVVRSTGAKEAAYSLEIFGIESLWQRPDRRTGSAWQAGLHLVGSYENKNSVDRQALGYLSTLPWYSSATLTGDLKVPVVRHLDLAGEWILANQTNGRNLPPPDCCSQTSGSGGLAGIVFSYPPNLKLRGDFVHLESGFSTPFSALSYVSNRQGFRLSGQVPLYRDIAVASLFYKQLRQINPYQAGMEKQKEIMYGGSLDVELPSGWGGSLGYMEDDGWDDISRSTDDTGRQTFVAAAGFRFNKVSSARFEYQRIDGYQSGAWARDYLTNLYSLYITARF